jgi:sterol desaturase/sphingolipid hydroxylase (fatty acid hydroxylase superfamily)
MLAHLLNLPLEPQGVAEWLAFGTVQFGGALALSAARYGLFAGAAFLILWVLLGRRLAHRRIQGKLPPARQLVRERLWSLSTIAIFALLALVTGIAYALGATSVYLDVGQYGWLYWGLSVVLLVVGHDTYFYWTHRVMHHRRLYRSFHRTHHRSVSPSPWAAYAFAPAEAVVEGAYLTIMVFLVPLHPTAILVFVVHQLVRNVLGHSGIELFPRGASHSRRLGWLTMTTHHDLHHSRVHGNYGLYFTWWDRWMGTEIADYKAVFDAVPRSPEEAEGAGVRARVGAAEAGDRVEGAGAPVAISPARRRA